MACPSDQKTVIRLWHSIPPPPALLIEGDEGTSEIDIVLEGGTTDPIETHVYLHTGADDATAQDIVRVGERTCFLHALCRDPVKPRAAYRRRRREAA